jgi:Kef-type K+ transport system membrane component KefB
MLHLLQAATPAAPASITGPLLITYVLVDVFLIVVLARILGTLMMKVGQPRVVGEILAGVLLGPTLLGATSLTIAPAEARPVIGNLATLALIMFMFLAGVEYDLSKVRGRGKHALILALLAVGVPALLGFPIAKLIHAPEYAGSAGSDLLPFALFIGAALSVTAFPVMAHILMERGELNSPMGSLGVATTGIMSVVMFSYIAFAAAVAAAKGYGDFVLKCGYIVLFGLTAWFAVRPLLRKLLPDTATGPPVTGNGMAIVFGGMVLFGLIGHVIGVHAMVGGFAYGLVIPASPRIRQFLADRLRDVAMIFFLPIFFAVAGFSTDLKLLGAESITAILLMLAGAIGGKFLAAAPARAFGLSWREVGILGALFNTRGLLVLVAGLMGLQLQIITVLTFTIIVVVALVTNLMTLPLLRLFTPQQVPQEPAMVQTRR